MTERPRAAPVPETPRRAPAPRFSVMICHDCCCGTDRKHPGVDHEGQREMLRDLESPAVRVRVVECLDMCDHSNVVLVRDHQRPRRERDTWLARIHDPSQVRAVEAFMADPTRLPEPLQAHVFDPERRNEDT